MMTEGSLALILCSVLFSASAQLVLKFGMSSDPIQKALALPDRFASAIAIATSAPVISGLAIHAMGAVVWLLVLARTDVSQAYPFVGLGFLLTMAFGWMLFGEHLSATRVLGTVLVTLGVYLTANG